MSNTNETKELLTEELGQKLNALREYIRSLGSLAVGFSGGVDSTLMLAAAHDVLGDKALAVTAFAETIPERSAAARTPIRKTKKRLCFIRNTFLEPSTLQWGRHPKL